MLLFPCLLLCLLAITSYTLLCFFYPKNYPPEDAQRTEDQSNILPLRLRVYRHISYIALTIAFFSYVPTSYTVLSMFNCNDVGRSGSFLRTDYSVVCSGTHYKTLFVLSALGIIVYTIGIPLLLIYIVRNRKFVLFERAASLITVGYKEKFVHYEVFDLFRKLLLTSVAQFVFPGTGSQCLFLLVVDGFFFIVVTITQPYLCPVDDFCARLFILTECCVYIIAMKDVSSMGATDGLSMKAFYTCLLVLLVFIVSVIVPVYICSRLPYLRPKFEYAVNRLRSTELPAFMSASSKVMELKQLSDDVRAQDAVCSGAVSISTTGAASSNNPLLLVQTANENTEQDPSFVTLARTSTNSHTNRKESEISLDRKLTVRMTEM